MKKHLIRTLLLLVPVVVTASPLSVSDVTKLKTNFLKNITDRGAVMASPSKAHPDYYYHWSRDGAITMGLIADWYAKDLSINNYKRLTSYVSWVEQAQQTLKSQHKSFGEPKFYLDGRVYDKPWGRPQNDGPALRAITLIKFANTLLQQKNEAYVKSHLYQASLDYLKMGVIKRDLEYTAHHWADKHFDLWEEAYGYHFFSSVVERKALLLGASLAKKLDDPLASQFYLQQAQRIERFLLSFVDIENRLVTCSLDATGPVKARGLDSSTILAFLYLDRNDPLYEYLSPYIENTATALEAFFKMEYSINQQFKESFLLGRYPGDTYDGYETNANGNPWFILTAVMASFHFQKAAALAGQHSTLATNWREAGDKYLSHLSLFIDNNHLSEQINRDSGHMQGARDLTWSYQSLLKALELREQIGSL